MMTVKKSIDNMAKKLDTYSKNYQGEYIRRFLSCQELS